MRPRTRFRGKGNSWELHGWQPCLLLFTTSSSPQRAVILRRDSSISQFLKELSPPAAERLSERGFVSLFEDVFCRWSTSVTFPSSLGRKAVVGSLPCLPWVSDLAEENSGGVCLVPLKWNMNRSSIWSSSFLCKWKSTSAGSAFSSSTFPSAIWKKVILRERCPIRFSNSLGGNERTGRKSCFSYTRSPLISPHTLSVT